jgi:hypothetical protein
VFPGATLNLLVDGERQEVEVFVGFDRHALLVLDERGMTLKDLPYSNIKVVEYTYSRSAHWKVFAAGAPDVSSASGNRHWLMVQTQDDYALLNLDNDNYQSAIAAFESRTGRKVEPAAPR